MPSKRKYLIPKVSAEGEDVMIDVSRFDALLQKAVATPPLPKAELEPRMLKARQAKSKKSI